MVAMKLGQPLADKSHLTIEELDLYLIVTYTFGFT
jgi:hypothetical protein